MQITQNLFFLFQDLFSSIVSYKITGENVAIKKELILSKMKLVNQTAFNVRIFIFIIC